LQGEKQGIDGVQAEGAHHRLGGDTQGVGLGFGLRFAGLGQQQVRHAGHVDVEQGAAVAEPRVHLAEGRVGQDAVAAVQELAHQ
jgi:hypothetical protein